MEKLKIKYKVYYQNIAYNEEYGNLDVIYGNSFSKSQIYFHIYEVPSVIDDELDYYEDEECIIVEQKEVIFDLDKNNEAKMYYGKTNRIHFDKRSKKLVEDTIDYDLYNLKNSMNKSMYLPSFFQNVLRNKNKKVYKFLTDDILSHIKLKSRHVDSKLVFNNLKMLSLDLVEDVYKILSKEDNESNIILLQAFLTNDFQDTVKNMVSSDNLPEKIIKIMSKRSSTSLLNDIIDMDLSKDELESLEDLLILYDLTDSNNISRFDELIRLVLSLIDTYDLKELVNYLSKNLIINGRKYSSILENIDLLVEYNNIIKNYNIKDYNKFPSNIKNSYELIKHNNEKYLNFLSNCDEEDLLKTEDEKLKNNIVNILGDDFIVEEALSYKDIFLLSFYLETPINIPLQKLKDFNIFYIYDDKKNNVAYVIYDKDLNIVNKYYKCYNNKKLLNFVRGGI